ncbi:hypothetical protein SPMU_33600 [Sphingomonas mucosissima]|uniref:Uncharacterized protein n=1 Tax=Sphingomonas mucosissima TaxID=370959 RepID=A0A245ZDC7_9SPHN|nr:hypothetical protein SPMU_33600 [Sphingomonas mucosissima]
MAESSYTAHVTALPTLLRTAYLQAVPETMCEKAFVFMPTPSAPF